MSSKWDGREDQLIGRRITFWYEHVGQCTATLEKIENNGHTYHFTDIIWDDQYNRPSKHMIIDAVKIIDLEVVDLSDKFLIVDGNSVVCRAYFAMPNLSYKGVATGGVFGFVNMFYNIVNQLNPKYIVVAFDVSKQNFRTELDSDYKANRVQQNPDLYDQFPMVKKMLDAIGVKHVGIQGYEADDVIGTYASMSTYTNCILTGDKDMFQLINDHTTVYFPKNGVSNMESIDEHTFFDQYGITPSQFIDLKALIGDGGDNVKGIPGVGQKTAVKLLVEHGNLGKIIESADKLKGKTGESIRNNLDKLPLYKNLVTIRKDVPVSYTVNECEVKINWANAFTLFEEWGFKSLLSRLDPNRKKPQEELIGWDDI